jgi:hypothetical protein
VTFGYTDLTSELLRRFPPLKERVLEEAGLWAPERIGGDILLADIFVPFVIDRIRGLPRTSVELKPIGAFIEELAGSANPDLRNAAWVSVLEALEDWPAELQVLLPFLGPATRRMLPTRRDAPGPPIGVEEADEYEDADGPGGMEDGPVAHEENGDGDDGSF